MSVGIGVIGTGRMGSIHLDAIANHIPGVHVEAVSGRDRNRTEQTAASFQVTTAYTEATDLISDPAVDAVVISSPAETHAELAISAIKVGKPVFIEKPLSSSRSDAKRVIDAEVAEHRRFVRLGFMRRYDPAYLELRDVVVARAIGSPLMVHCAHRLAAVPPSFHSEMLITEGLTHEIDVARWMTGGEIASARVYTPSPSGSAAPGVSDPQFTVFEMDSGQLIGVEVSVNAGYAYDIRCEVVCKEGTVELDDFSTIRIRHEQRASSPLSKGWAHRFAEAYRSEMRSWINDVTHGVASGPTAWHGYAAAVVAEACVESLRSGIQVAIDLTPRPGLYPPAS